MASTGSLKQLAAQRQHQEIAVLFYRGKQELSKMQAQSSLFIFENDALIEGFLTQLQNSQVRTVGPELIFGKIYDAIGFNAVQEDIDENF